VVPPTTPPRINDAHHVSKVIGIARTGNRVFNDQIVAKGIKTIMVMIKRMINKILVIV
jgi:protein involved in ribonucleotide reduction